MATEPSFVLADLPREINRDPLKTAGNNQQPQNLSSTAEGGEISTSSEEAAQVVTHSFHPETQQSVLFQALTAQPHFIALTVPIQDIKKQEVSSSQEVQCAQYVDEGGGTNVFSTLSNQMTTFSIYTAPESANMYTPNTTAYYNTNNSSESYSEVNICEDPQSFSEDQEDVFHVDGNVTESENNMSCYPSSRLSAASMRWLIDNYEMSDGMSVPRSTMYTQYFKYCREQKMEPLNAASFGKLIRMVFNGLRTRRLGTRGNSKYHYYGIRLKPTSSINKAMEDIGNTTYRHNSFTQMRRLKSDAKTECNGKRLFQPEVSDKKRSSKHELYLGDASTAIPDVEIEISVLPHGVTLDKICIFKNAYKRHCEFILEAVINFQFSDVETLWNSFWNTSSENRNQSDLSKSFLRELVSCEPVKEFIKQTDYQFYQNLVDVLIPDVLRPIPSTLTQAIRNFAKSLEGWLKGAITECGEDILNIKLSAISAFAQTLRRYTSLNHLAQAARAVLQSASQIKQMTSDLNKVDFRNIQEQASWVCQCEDEVVKQILFEFRETLQHNMWLEEWATWLENIVHRTLEPYEGKPSYPKAARQFLLKWSFYSSLVIRDLTLRSAASFGSFHLLRLLYDEFMFYVIEHCIARATGTTSIAVMGEYLCCGVPERLSDESSNSSEIQQE
nr:transcription factor RFX3 isoform X1 [Parasteatoda tepidariorum]